MDYVLFGMGYGATLMLLGWALRTFGPERKYKDIDPEDIDLSILKRRWIRFIQGLGGVVSIAGTAMVFFTMTIMLVNPKDETGSFIALVIWGFLAVAILAWCWFYVASFGAVGIWSKEDGYGFRSKSTSVANRRTERKSAGSTSRVIPKPRIPTDSVSPEIGPSSNRTEPEIAEAEKDYSSTDRPTVAFQETDSEESQEVQPDTLESEVAEAVETGPEYDFGDGTDTTVPSEVGGRTEAIRRLRERQARSGNSSN